MAAMTRLRLGLARAATFLSAVLLWTWLAVKVVVTLIGATTVGDDYNQMVDRLPAVMVWLFSTPWWVPALLATALTAFLIWLSWPRPTQTAKGGDPAPPPPTDEPIRPASFSFATPAVDMEIDLSRISAAAPWLQFHCTAYNATGCSFRLISAQGRIKIGGEEFHSKLELDNLEFMYPPDAFFYFSLKSALSASEAGYLQGLSVADHFSVIFLEVSIEVSVHTKSSNSTLWLKLPKTLQFSTRDRRPAPAFVQQIRPRPR